VSQPKLFKYRHFEPGIVLLCVRWYLRYSLSYRDLEEMMAERGLSVDHTTIYRWVQHFAPLLEKKCRAKLKPANDSWRVDETYIKVKGQWMYLYRAVDSDGNTVEFMLSPTRDAVSAKRFFRKALRARHTVAPRVINVDRNPAYPKAVGKLKKKGTLWPDCKLRPIKYLNNLRVRCAHAGPPLHQTPYKPRHGVLVIRDSLADAARLRGDASTTERSGSGYK
jgi:transposase, IS6 family